jgi:DNA polymerase-3 subunit delta
MTFEQITADLKKKIYHSVYFLQGDEPFYIDQISDYIENNILTDSEKEFNQTVVYGKDLDVLTLISFARRYPMMSSHQVIIVKEAQDLKTLFSKDKAGNTNDSQKNKDPFADYLAKPTNSTILVFCYKYSRLDKRTKISKLIEKNAVLFDSKKMYDNQLPAWITQYVASKGLKIDAKASVMIADNLGNELSKIANEITKLSLNLKPGGAITPAMVEEYIGVSKDFNIFELQNAIGNRNVFKAFRIVEYFAANPKSNPLVLSITQLYAYFMKVLSYHQLEDRSKNNAASELGVNPYFLNDYIKAAKEYSPAHCLRNIGYIHEYDLKSKGVNNISTDDGDLLKELVYKILN